jgi:hypothetical protein
MSIAFGTRRAEWVRLADVPPPLAAFDLARFEAVDLFYRSVCALLYNYVPMSGHPGGSISSGRFVAGILFDAMDYDLAKPDRADADIVSYAAGHKAMGLYAMWALRDELARVGDPSLLPERAEDRLRLEDLLGFRRNPTSATPLFRKFGAKALDGHPTPATPFVRLSTGASGVGIASSIGLPGSTWSRAREASPPAAWRKRSPWPAPRPSTTSSSTWTGTRPRSTRTACAARMASPVTTSSGHRWSCSTCTTGT